MKKILSLKYAILFLILGFTVVKETLYLSIHASFANMTSSGRMWI